MPHLPYLHDLASSDFYLFPMSKQKLESVQVADNDYLFECLQEVLRCIDQAELNQAFHAWMQRVPKAHQGNRDYIR
jgi:uncharacterized protein YecT (DUF1311 family)